MVTRFDGNSLIEFLKIKKESTIPLYFMKTPEKKIVMSRWTLISNNNEIFKFQMLISKKNEIFIFQIVCCCNVGHLQAQVASAMTPYIQLPPIK